MMTCEVIGGTLLWDLICWVYVWRDVDLHREGVYGKSPPAIPSFPNSSPYFHTLGAMLSQSTIGFCHYFS